MNRGIDRKATRRSWRLMLATMMACCGTLLCVPPAWTQEQESSEAKPANERAKERRRSRAAKAAGRQEQQNAERAHEDEQPSGGDEIPPEMQKRINELLGPEAQKRLGGSNRAAVQEALEALRARNRRGAKSAAPTIVSPDELKPEEPTTGAAESAGAALDNAQAPKLPVTPPDDLPPEERTYTFSIKDGTYEQLVEGFSRQTGLGVVGDAPKDGKVSFVTTQELTFQEALSRIRMLLFNYKPHEPYWLRYEDSHLRVIRVTDLYRELGPERMFRNVEDLRAANLSEDELALVIYTPKSGSVADLRQVRDFLPDYVRVAPMENQNSVTIFALIKDIKKYLSLIDFFSGDGSDDPRTLERIEVKYVLPSEAIEKLRQLMTDLGPSGRSSRSVPTRGRDISPLDTMPEPEITIIPEDTQGFIVVRAMQDKLQEIRHLLRFIDVETPMVDTPPAVIPVEHGDPQQIVAVVQQILSATSPEAGATPTSARRRRRRSGSTGSQPVTAEGITLLAHPSERAIVVVGDDAQVARVRELVALVDRQSQVGPVRIDLKYSSANDVTTSIVNVLSGGAVAAGKPTGHKFVLVADPGDEAMWFTGSDRELEKVREMVAALDVPGETVSLRVVELARQKPSFVANVLKEYEAASEAAAARATPVPRGRRRRTSQGGTKFNANDELQRLFVLCTDSEWEVYKPIIDQLDGIGRGGPFVRMELEHLDPESAIEQLGAMTGSGGPQPGPVRYAAVEAAILVIGATERQVADVKAFLAEIDKPAPIVQRTFELKFADATELKSAIETLLGEGGTRRGRRPRTRRTPGQTGAAVAAVSEDLTILPMGSRLVVRASPGLMEEVAALVAEFDVEEATSEIRVYDSFPTGADIEAISDTLQSFLPVGGGPGPRGRRAAGDKGGPSAQFLAQPASGRLVVMAEPSAFPEIENLLNVLRTEVNVDPVQAVFFKVEHADAAELVEMIQPLLELKVRRLVEAGELETGADAAALPQARRRVARGGSGSQRYHMAANLHNTGIVVAAPQKIVSVARELIEQFDQAAPEDEEVVFTTVPLSNADAAGMVKALNEMVRADGVRRGRRRAGRKGAPAADANEQKLTIVEAPGGGAIVLQGPKSEVAQATDWIERLDSVSTRGRSIKVYDIEHADVERLCELVINVVEPPAAPTARRPSRRRMPGQEEEEDAFEVFKTWDEPGIYIQADLVGRTMLVATSESRLAEIDAIVARVDSAEPEIPIKSDTVLPKRIVELKFRDPFDAAWDLETLLAQVWEPQDNIPKVEAGAFGDILIVRYPYEERFAEVEELIRKYIDVVPEEETRTVRKSFTPPPGMSAEEVAGWILLNHPEYQIELEDISEKAQVQFDVERVRPPVQEQPVNPCVLPGAFARMTQAVLAGSVLQAEPDEEEPDPEDIPPDEEMLDPLPEGELVPLGATSDQLLETAGTRVQHEEEKDEEGKKRRANKGLTGEKLKVYYDKDKGVLVIEGPAGVVDNEVPEWMTELEEEIKDFPVAPDIRIYRVKYIDVLSAQDIIEEMFGISRQQRNMIQQQQRILQQQQRLQRIRQQRQARAQQQGRGQSGEQDQQGRPGQQQEQQQQQQQLQMPQLPTTQVRVYPNPRDRTLILRAETNQYPAIEELLATIDQPKPLDSELKIFKLDKLNAADVEAMLTDMLELEEAREGGSRRRRASAEPTGPGAQLPRTIMQDVVSGTGQLGVDPEDIKISSNAEANTIIVMAPKSAVEFIGDLIEQLESEDIPERVTEYFELTQAPAEDVAGYLESHFAEKRRRSSGQSGAKASAAGDLNTPSFISYPRLNLVTVHATQEQMAEVKELVAKLDVPGGEDKWEYVTLEHADAKSVADTLTKMFAEGAGRGSGRGAGGSGAAPKFIADDAGRVLLYSAPANLREQIVAAVERLEAEAADTSSLRVIELKHATASKAAEAVQAAFARDRGRGSAGRGRFSITPHDASKRLFVMADDARFAEIESLVTTLDQTGEMGFDFRVYTLQHADAKKVHATMTKLITGYVQRTRGSDMEPFSVEVDEQTNSLVVLGGPVVFDFIEENLKKVDTPANAARPPGFFMVSLENADAQEVAANINRLWAQRDRQSSETPPQAEANRSLNMLIVRGTQQQIDEIKKEFVDPLKEQAAPALTSETITLEHAEAEGVAESLNRMFEDMKRAYQSLGGRGAGAAPIEYTVAITAEPNTNQILVQASEQNMARIKARVAELDREGVATAATSIRIYPVKNADLNSVVNIINQWARTKQQTRRGRTSSPSDVVNASAEPATQSVVVTASESNHLIVQDLIDGIDVKSAEAQRNQEVIKLTHANATETANQLTQVYRASARSRSGDPGPSFVADPKTNSVVATVNEEERADVAELIAKIDVELPAEGKRVTEVYPLQFADPGALNSVVLNWFRWDRGSQPPPWEQVTSAVEWATQSLVVTASPQNHALIRKLVEKIDVEGTMTKGNFVRKLEHANAEEVAQSLQRVYSSRRATRRGEQPVSITPDAATNSLVIVANQAELEEIDALLESLDVPPDMDRKPQIKTIKLTHADPWAVQDAVNQIFRAGARNPRDQVTAVPDFASRSVVISAWPEQMARVEQLIAQVDAEEADQRQVKVLNLTNAEADGVARTLNDIFVRSAPRRRGGAEAPISISAVTGAKAILVRADQVEMAEIEAVVTELDREDTLAGDTVRVVSLQFGDASEMQKALQETFRKPGGRGQELVGDVRISALPQSNSLMVSGGAEMVERIEAQVQELDAASESGSVPKLIVLEHAKVGQVLPSVQEMYADARGRQRGGQPPPVIAGNEALNALIVRAAPTDLSGIEAIVKSLDTPEAADKPNFRLIQVSQGINVNDLAEKVAQAVNEGAAAQATGGRRSGQIPRITVTPDARTASLVVAGTPTLFDQAEELVRAMEKMGPSGGRSTVVVRLKNVPADDIQRLIDQLTGEDAAGGGRSRASSPRRSSRPRTTGPGASRSRNRRR